MFHFVSKCFKTPFLERKRATCRYFSKTSIIIYPTSNRNKKYLCLLTQSALFLFQMFHDVSFSRLRFANILVPFFTRFLAYINSLHENIDHLKKLFTLVSIFSFFFSFQTYLRYSLILIELYLSGKYRIKSVKKEKKTLYYISNYNDQTCS